MIRRMEPIAARNDIYVCVCGRGCYICGRVLHCHVTGMFTYMIVLYMMHNYSDATLVWLDTVGSIIMTV